MMTVARMTRLGLGRVLSPPVFIDSVADFAQAREFTRQFQELDGSEILHRVWWWVAQRFEQADANQHRNVMLGKAQQNGGLLYVEHGRQSPQVEQFFGLCGNKFRFAIRLCSQRFIDFAIHSLSSVKVMTTEATTVALPAGRRSSLAASRLPRWPYFSSFFWTALSIGWSAAPKTVTTAIEKWMTSSCGGAAGFCSNVGLAPSSE